MSSGLYSGQPGLSLGTGLYRTVSGLWSGASGLTMAFGGAGMPLSLNFLTMTAYTLDPRITFSRGSQAMVTDATGKLTYAPNNLLTNSESFEAATWIKDEISITTNAGVAPFGTTTADKIIPSTVSSIDHRVRQLQATNAGAALFISVYAKADGYPKFGLREGNFTGAYATFDLTNGTVIAQGSGGTGSIQSIGNGWYRCIVQFTAGGGNARADIYSLPSEYTTGSPVLLFTGNGTSGTLVWGAQLEAVTYQTTPSPYVSTTPKNLLGYTQEFDNAAWTKSNAFVQTNLLTNSENFTAAAWTSTNVTTANNAIASPIGTMTAGSITGSSSTANFKNIGNAWNTTTTGTYTLSVYLKAGTASTAVVRTNDNSGSNQARVTVDLVNGTLSAVTSAGTVTGSSATITNAGNGWYRVALTTTYVSALTQIQLNIWFDTWGNSTNTGTMYLWGAQAVQGATAGDYQPTYAAAAAVQYAAPDNSLTADKLVENTATSSHGIVFGSNPSIPANTPIAVSIYVKPDGRNLRVTAYTASNGLRATFNFSTLAVTNGSYGNSTYTSGTITDVGGGWYRITLLGIASSTETNPTYAFEMLNGTTLSYAGDGNSGLFIWGAQLSNSASVDPYVYNPVAAPSSTAYYGPRFDYDPVTLAPRGLLIEEQRTNLLTYSEQFDNAVWGKTNSTIAANVIISPDGTVNADKLQEDSATAGHVLVASPTMAASTTYTLSVYMKAAERTFGVMNIYTGAASCWTWFNLSTGVVSTLGAGATATITPAANGWYRCTLTIATAATGSPNVAFWPANANGSLSYAGTTGYGIYIWGAQLEAGSFATSYIPTAASTVTRSADVALMQGANFSNWYNQNEGSFVTGIDYFGYSSFNPFVTAGSSSTASIQLGINSASVARIVVENGTTQANIPASSTALSINAAHKVSGAYVVNDFAVSLDGATAGTSASGSVPACNQLAIGSAVGLTRYLNGHIRSIQYYNTRLPNAQLQALTS